jgi:acetoin:2,6-dichlorophenolindophenol oxidoreductase subunit alpha
MTTTPKKSRNGKNLRPFYEHVSPSEMKEALRRMLLIRMFEEKAEDSYVRGLTHGTMHLSIGQEASAVGITMALRKTDYITSTHRGHGHCIGKGAEAKYMFAEFFGKEEGYCRGRGGSMHIADPESGNLGANGIVGGGLPIAVGAALAIKQQKRDDVAVCFFGDGASNEGAFHESLNMAAIWKLPVIFVCENNKYGMSVSTERSMSVPNVADRAPAYNMPGVIVDGNNIADVAEAMMVASARARAGEGPTLIECKTYRTRGHSRSDRNKYRTKEEIEEWKLRDPIPHFVDELIENGILDAKEADTIKISVAAEIEDGFNFAVNGTDPSPDTLTRDVYTRVLA